MPHSYSLRSKSQKASATPPAQRAAELMDRMEYWMGRLTAKDPQFSAAEMRLMKAELAEAATVCAAAGVSLEL